MYGSAITVAATTTIKALALAAGYTNSAVASGTFTMASATNAPVNVALSTAANVYAIANNGTGPAGGGMDGDGSAYSGTLLASSVNWSGVTFAMGGAAVLDMVLKWAVHRPRPDEVYAHTMPASYSFPSGHAIYSLTFYISIAIIMSHNSRGNQTRAIWIVTVMMFALIGMSRIFLGVHYGSDVLGGYLVAALWLMFILMWTETTVLQSASKN